MKNFIIRIVLSLALTASIINLSFSTYNRIADKPVEIHKILTAPIVQYWLALIQWIKAGGLSGGSHPYGRPENKPERPEKHSPDAN